MYYRYSNANASYQIEWYFDICNSFTCVVVGSSYCSSIWHAVADSREHKEKAKKTVDGRGGTALNCTTWEVKCSATSREVVPTSKYMMGY